jgi:hypothetical protein
MGGDMGMLRTTVAGAAAAALAISVLGAAPAAAGPPGSAGTCPGRAAATTEQQLVALALENGVPEANAHALFATVNKNDDSWICVKRVPNQTGFNFTDNQAVGLSR